MIRMTNFCSTALPTILREGAGGGSGGGGLVDLDANEGDGGNGGGDGNGAAQTVEVDFGGEKIALPSKAAEELTSLRGKIADHGKVTAPETYALNLPDALKGKVEVSDKHPLYAPVSEWARKHNLPQEAFDELVGIQLGAEAGRPDDIDVEAEKGKLLTAFNDGGKLTAEQAQAKANEVGRWAAGLLKPAIEKNKALAVELAALTATADGVLLLRTLMDRVKEAVPPKSGGGQQQRNPLDALYPSMK